MRANRLSLCLLTALTAFSATGCMGTLVEVPTAHKGKVLTTAGLAPEVRPPSTFRLPYDFWGNNPTELILVEASDEQKETSMIVWMPEDKMNLDLSWRGVFSIASDDKAVDQVYGRVSAKPLEGKEDVMIIDFDDIYKIYGDWVVNATGRTVATKYTIEYVLSHREEVSEEGRRAVEAHLAGTPVKVVSFGLSRIQPPTLIIEAQQKTKEREVAIEQAKADRLVKLKEAESALEVARKQQQVDLLHADTQRQVGLKLTSGVNKAFVQQRLLVILEKLAVSNDRIFILPEQAFQNPAMMMPVNGQILSGNPNKPIQHAADRDDDDDKSETTPQTPAGNTRASTAAPTSSSLAGN